MAEVRAQPRGYSLPTLDLSEHARRRVIVDQEADRYLGQPDTVLLADGRTIIVAYPRGHGGPDTLIKRSDDAGRTWSERLPVPDNFIGKHNAPSVHRLTDPRGVERLILVVSYPVMLQSVSEDNGRTWTPLQPMFSDELRGTPGDKGHAPPKSVVPIAGGRYLMMYHDHFDDETGYVVAPMQVISEDGGLTWSEPRRIDEHPLYPGAQPCEPCLLRSPDGKQLLCLMREESRQYNSLMMLSDDEGETWSEMVELPGSLTGDRHIARYGPDGRIVVTFRDMTHISPTHGDFVAWVGTYEDIIAGREGQYRVRLLNNKGKPGDTGYAGLEVLPDGSFVSTTYCVLAQDQQPLVVSVRFILEEVDEMPAAPEHVDVFVSGEDGVCEYRIPALVVTNEGTLVAVCDARVDRRGDAPNNIDLVMKRSFDNGKTWSPLQVIRRYPGDEAACDPCALVDRDTGAIWIFYDYAIPDADLPERRKLVLHVISSRDDGETWSEPVDLIAALQPPVGMRLLAGPGMGIQMHSGRLVAPIYCRHITGEPSICHVVYSDDHGETWQIGAGVGTQVNEAQVVELSDGSLMINMRRADERLCRSVATSNDGGESWSEPRHDETLIDPHCQASFVRLTDSRDAGSLSRLLFANCASAEARVNGTVRLSYDEGLTWPVAKTIYDGEFAYCCLTVLPDDTIGLLYEGDDYAKLTLARFTLDWLTDGKDSLSASGPPKSYSIPTIDLSRETDRQVTVDREAGQYLGHPTTVLLEDGRTILCVYPKGHGAGAVVFKKSTDGGLTWSDRLPTPKSWETSLEVPTLYRVTDPQGVKRLIMFSGLYPIRMAVSEDDGETWSELAPIGDFGGVVAMADVMRLKDGRYMATFHDDNRFLHNAGERVQYIVYKTLSEDGGLTWGEPQAVTTRADCCLCEPGLIRSPDGGQIAMLLRENSRTYNSFVTFSDDEGETWSEPRQLPGSLTGDRHQALYAPDGRLFISFRDTTLISPTAGDWVAWVGTYEDIVAGREGQYRVRLMANHNAVKTYDCAYPARELLPDGTIVTITYGHWVEGEEPFIAGVRLKLDELDARAADW